MCTYAHTHTSLLLFQTHADGVLFVISCTYGAAHPLRDGLTLLMYKQKV